MTSERDIILGLAHIARMCQIYSETLLNSGIEEPYFGPCMRAEAKFAEIERTLFGAFLPATGPPKTVKRERCHHIVQFPIGRRARRRR